MNNQHAFSRSVRYKLNLGAATETDRAAFTLFESLCNQYERSGDGTREKSSKVLEALIEFYDYHGGSSDLTELYKIVRDDASRGQCDAELKAAE